MFGREMVEMHLLMEIFRKRPDLALPYFGPDGKIISLSILMLAAYPLASIILFITTLI